MDRPGRRTGGALCIAITLIVGGLALWLAGALPGALPMAGVLAPSSDRLRWWGEVVVLLGAGVLALTLLVARWEGRGSPPRGGGA